MNIRTTIALVIILALVIGISAVYVKQRGDAPPAQVSVRRDFFYLVDDDDIKKVGVSYQGQTAGFVTDPEGKWRFSVADGEPVNMERWGGVTLLLSGPQFKRVITEKTADFARYGLEKPSTVITVGLKDIGEVLIRLGDKTPDGGSHYARFKDSEAVYLVDSSWGEVLSRLVTDPPRIKPTPAPGTPTPEGGQTPTPAAART